MVLTSQDIFKKDCIHLFLETGEGREKERERNITVRDSDRMPLTRPQPGTWPTTQARALTGIHRNPSVHRPALRPLSHTSWGQDNSLKVSVILPPQSRHNDLLYFEPTVLSPDSRPSRTGLVPSAWKGFQGFIPASLLGRFLCTPTPVRTGTLSTFSQGSP